MNHRTIGFGIYAIFQQPWLNSAAKDSTMQLDLMDESQAVNMFMDTI